VQFLLGIRDGQDFGHIAVGIIPVPLAPPFTRLLTPDGGELLALASLDGNNFVIQDSILLIRSRDKYRNNMLHLAMKQHAERLPQPHERDCRTGKVVNGQQTIIG
jgi:hypothetical protein